MKTRLAVSSLCAAAALVLATGALAAEEPSAKSGAAPFDTVARVLLHPRCRNCHPDGDRPLQLDEGKIHAQEVGRRASKLGLECGACHQAKMPVEPIAGPHAPPGAPNWGLPPESTPMVFEGRTPAQLCRQLKDPAQTGGRDLAAVLHHLAEDELVAYGWNPGEGRTPVPVPREELVAAFKAWMDAGAPCSDEGKKPSP